MVQSDAPTESGPSAAVNSQLIPACDLQVILGTLGFSPAAAC
jgi:hypothetical protein